MKQDKTVARISIGLSARELEALNQAFRIRYTRGPEAYIDPWNRGMFIRLAVSEYCLALVRLGEEYDSAMLACDLRRETPEERAARIGEPMQQQLELPDNIVELFPAAECNCA